MVELKQDLAKVEGMFRCSLCGLFSIRPACYAVISVWRNFKEYRRAQAERLEKSMWWIDVRFCGRKHSGAWNGIHGIAHERGVEKASQHSSLRHRHLLEG